MDQNLDRKWKPIITKFESSGLSKSAFCKANGLKLHQLDYWGNKFKKISLAINGPDSFVPLKSQSEFKIKLAGGLEIIFDDRVDPVWVSKLILELGARQ